MFSVDRKDRLHNMHRAQKVMVSRDFRVRRTPKRFLFIRYSSSFNKFTRPVTRCISLTVIFNGCSVAAGIPLSSDHRGTSWNVEMAPKMAPRVRSLT